MAEENQSFNAAAEKIQQIMESLDGTIAQIEKLNSNIEDNNRKLMQKLAATEENMRLIIQVIKKQRTNIQDSLQELKDHIDEEIQKLWDEKSLESITKDEMKAVEKLKDINKSVSENLYMAQLLSIIQSLREITGRAMAIKMKKQSK